MITANLGCIFSISDLSRLLYFPLFRSTTTVINEFLVHFDLFSIFLLISSEHLIISLFILSFVSHAQLVAIVQSTLIGPRSLYLSVGRQSVSMYLFEAVQ